MFAFDFGGGRGGGRGGGGGGGLPDMTIMFPC